jgi:hypothetical protein
MSCPIDRYVEHIHELGKVVPIPAYGILGEPQSPQSSVLNVGAKCGFDCRYCNEKFCKQRTSAYTGKKAVVKGRCRL